MSLTDTVCRTAKPKDKSYKLSDGHSLYLEIMPNGSKFWRWKYYMGDKEKRLSLGRYPLVTLAEAREARDKARKQLTAGHDPSLAKQEKKRLSVIKSGDTFEAIALEWHEKNKAKWSENHAGTVLRRLEMDLFPAIGNVPVKDITTPRFVLVIESIEKRGAHVMARRALQYSRAVFAYAKIKGKMDHNPADIKAKDFLAPAKEGHFAAMEPKELPAFLKKLRQNETRQFPQTQLAMELMILTFVRTNELIKARWEQFDFEKGQWIIPAEQMKMGRDHLIPLSTQALSILQKLKEINGHREWVFTNQRDPRKPMSNGALLMVIERMGYRGIHTPHGFRSLATTIIMEELGYPYDIPDTQLAHAKESDVRRAYDRTKYLPQRKQMMQEWADYLDKILKD